MNEITKVAFENEMDLVIAHRQCMKLAELADIPLPGQTTFATAVSEIVRNSMERHYDSSLTLFISDKKDKVKYIVAAIEDNRKTTSENKDEGFRYAKKLVSNIETYQTEKGTKIELRFRIPDNMRIDNALIEKWRTNLNVDPPVSPYEEIKRKNRQLVALAEKLRVSEHQYKTLTDSLPLMIFSVTADGQITYANKWLEEYTGETVEQINESNWQNVVHTDDFADSLFQHNATTEAPSAIAHERRLKHAGTGEYKWHAGISIAIYDDEGAVTCWNTFLVDINAQKVIEQTLKDNVLLKKTQRELEEKITLLNSSNRQLEQFAYIAAHDLQEPLRKISFYSDFLNTKYSHAFPGEVGVFFNNLIQSAARMKTLIQDVLAYSTIRNDGFVQVELNNIIADVLEDLEISIQEKSASIQVGELPAIDGNSRQLKQLFENIISNSLKYAREGVPPEISITAESNADTVTLSFSDNGIGFEEEYVNRMFDIFQRLHTREKYPGTGIGLALCKKIVDLYHGHITARGTLNEGAVFLVTLPLRQVKPQS